jgi:hypothetical protein
MRVLVVGLVIVLVFLVVKLAFHDTDVSEIELSDGTHCVIAEGRGTSISCDWDAPDK